MPEEAKTEKKPEAKTEKKPEGWDRSLRHYGTFVDFRKRSFPAYMEFNDVDDPKTRGWRLFCAATRKEFKPGVVFLHPEHLKTLRLDFTLSNVTEDAKKEPKQKLETKSQRNKRMAAAAPKEGEDE